MSVLRVFHDTDLEALVRLAAQAGPGMTSLPRERTALADKIRHSRDSFAAGPRRLELERLFFFALEQDGALIGSSAVKAGIGLTEPFYSYRLDKTVHASRALGIHTTMQSLHLSNDYTGASELSALFLDPAQRGGGRAQLLSRARLLFVAEHAEVFPDPLIADLRGVSDASGRSPFWDSLGRHFFGMDFPVADHLATASGKSFIAELMPRHPIYVSLLPVEAQAVIGEVHPATVPARHMLEAEGFAWEGYVDIFDAGPTLEARAAQLRSVRDSQVLEALAGPVAPDAPRWLISNRGWADFRCVLAPAVRQGDELRLDAGLIEALQKKAGDTLRAVEV